MEVWPAIDLRGGKCVRLRQGNYDVETVFGDDPVAMAQRWQSLGAERLHLVDLDGARDGAHPNLSAIQGIVAALSIPCQLGGGIRDEGSIERLLAIGLRRLVVGTRAVKDATWFREMCQRFPHRLVLGIDARDGFVATEGWLQVSDCDAIELAKRFADEPLAAIVYTDIAKDGMLQGPNFSALQRMIQAVKQPVIASGGVTSLSDVGQLREMGAAGCIVGRALYEGHLEMSELLAAAQRK